MAAVDILTRSDLGALEYLAEGGQAKVYEARSLRLPDCPTELVYKEYKSGQAPNSGLEQVVGFRRKLSVSERDRLDAVAAWPARVVKDGARTRGLVMPRIPERYFFTRRSLTGEVRTKPLEVQFLFQSKQKCMRLGVPPVNLNQRFAVCRELAAAIAVLHGHEFMFGDLNAKNEVFHVPPGTDDASVMLVDCDAVRKIGSSAIVAQLNSPDWEPPPAEKNLTRETDVYKLGLFILRSLSPGTNTSATPDPSRLDDVLDASGRDLLRRSLSVEKANRPAAEDWREYFAARPRGASTGAAPQPRREPTWRPRPNRQPRPERDPQREQVDQVVVNGPVMGPRVGWVRDGQGNWVRPS